MSSEASAYSSRALVSLVEIDLRARPNESAYNRLPSVPGLCQLQESADEDLLFQISDGNKEALSVLFRRHAHTVHNVARRILRDDSEAEDLLQDLFLFIFQKARTFDRTKASASSWIIQMAYHRAIDRLRYLRRRQHYNGEELDEDRLVGHRGEISIDELAARDLLNKLRNDLSADQQQTLELHFYEGYTFQEIAEKRGQTLGNIRNHYYRGLERLRSHIFAGKQVK